MLLLFHPFDGRGTDHDTSCPVTIWFRKYCYTCIMRFHLMDYASDSNTLSSLVSLFFIQKFWTGQGCAAAGWTSTMLDSLLYWAYNSAVTDNQFRRDGSCNSLGVPSESSTIFRAHLHLNANSHPLARTNSIRCFAVCFSASLVSLNIYTIAEHRGRSVFIVSAIMRLTCHVTRVRDWESVRFCWDIAITYEDQFLRHRLMFPEVKF